MDSLKEARLLQDIDHAHAENRDGRLARLTFLGLMLSATGLISYVSFQSTQVLFFLLIIPYIFMFMCGLLSHFNHTTDANKGFVRDKDKEIGYEGQQAYMDAKKKERAAGRHALAMCAVVQLLQVCVIAMAIRIVLPGDSINSIDVAILEVWSLVGTWLFLCK